MHIGTFTRAGTWQAAQHQLTELADCGITLLEVMPVADFPGRFGWGYDGVGMFAPFHLYGEPNDFRRFVDATHRAGLGAIFDASPENIMMAIGRRVRETACGRKAIIVAENEPQQTKLIRPIESGGYGLDALWNDDFHHSGMVAMTGRNEAYYTDYLGKPQEFISMVKYGYLYQGQRYKWQK